MIGLVCAVCIGCYREPTDPAQARQNTESRRRSAEPEMPRDSIHAGIADAGNAVIESRDVEIGMIA